MAIRLGELRSRRMGGTSCRRGEERGALHGLGLPALEPQELLEVGVGRGLRLQRGDVPAADRDLEELRRRKGARERTAKEAKRRKRRKKRTRTRKRRKKKRRKRRKRKTRKTRWKITRKKTKTIWKLFHLSVREMDARASDKVQRGPCNVWMGKQEKYWRSIAL